MGIQRAKKKKKKKKKKNNVEEIKQKCRLGTVSNEIDLFHIVFAHAYSGHVMRYFSIIGETLHRWGQTDFKPLTLSM